MAPKKKTASDVDRCGGCARTVKGEDSLVCWGNLPHVQIDELGNHVQLRECVVDADDIACFAFTPRSH